MLTLTDGLHGKRVQIVTESYAFTGNIEYAEGNVIRFRPEKSEQVFLFNLQAPGFRMLRTKDENEM